MRSALAKAPEPPEPHAIDHVVRVLTGLGLIEPDGTDSGEDLTPLGHTLAALPVDPRVGKLVLLGALFRCLSPALVLAAALGSRSPFVSPPPVKREAAAAAKRSLSSWSDHAYCVSL